MAEPYPWATNGGAFDHVGILTEDFDSVVALFSEQLGFDVAPPEDDEELGLSFLWVQCGGVSLEFIAPLMPDNGAAKRLRARGPGVDHIALRVASVADSLDWCRRRGIPCVDEVPRRGAQGSQIAFLAPEVAGGARVELVERVGDGAR
jgi:methylmalonyl-CoA epimerase